MLGLPEAVRGAFAAVAVADTPTTAFFSRSYADLEEYEHCEFS